MTDSQRYLMVGIGGMILFSASRFASIPFLDGLGWGFGLIGAISLILAATTRHEAGQ
ncbi:hypothetical protein J2Y69_002117 [Microbacterium resistens]|uniref:Uncharacterized protein n=1 Tax=Microbacterium resistens TaxID=156977 RepID=A0ABU1SE32_9MICO|nr:hypothetical protein [Microbacterium resistens]MDR6867513.1 hypothetical protein [Microbacterium resistens]